MLEAIAIRLEAVASRLEAIAIRLEAMVHNHKPKRPFKVAGEVHVLLQHDHQHNPSQREHAKKHQDLNDRERNVVPFGKAFHSATVKLS